MKSKFFILPLLAMVVMMSLICSCGYIGKKLSGSPSDPFVGKTYKGSGNGGGLYTEMTITFNEDNKCVCVSDWYRDYETSKEIEGTYEVKDKQVIVRCKDGEIDYEFVFDVIENGRFIGFDHSDPSMGGTMGNDIMSLELQGSESIPSKTSDSKETAEIPSIQKIGSMFDDMLKGKMSALTDYGFSMDDKQTKTESEEEEGIDGTSSYKYVVVKEIYSLNYKLYEKDGNMRVSYVYSKDYGGPSMTINCDSESWEQLKREAETTLKELSDDSYWLSTNSYVSFPKKGVISITSEDSISW